MAENEVPIDTERGVIYVDKAKFDDFMDEVMDLVKGCMSWEGEFYYEDWDNSKEEVIKLLNNLLA